MAKSENIFVRAKGYQKQHPRTPWAECIQKVKGKRKVSGAAKSKAKVAGVAKKRRSRTNTHPVASSRTVQTRIQKGTKILNKIDSLEAKAKEISNKDLKHLYYVEINALHARLNKLKKSA